MPLFHDGFHHMVIQEHSLNLDRELVEVLKSKWKRLSLKNFMGNQLSFQLEMAVAILNLEPYAPKFQN